MTIPEKLKFVLMKDYYMEYTKDDELIIKGKIQVSEMAVIKRCLKKWKTNCKNIIVE